MSYYYQRRRVALVPGIPRADGLGFSLKPPRFIRKLQPGKVLKKIAIPLAVAGAALLIPGAAPLALRGVGLLSSGAKTLLKRAPGLIQRNAGALMPSAAPQSLPMIPAPAPVTPESAPTLAPPEAMAPVFASGGGGSPVDSGSVVQAGPGDSPNLMPVLLALGAFALLSSRRR